jgi:hypothetical protein
MTTTTAQINPYPDIAPPAGARPIEDWQAIEPQPYRVVIGDDRTVTDHKLRVSPTAIQLADGSIDDGTTIEAPCRTGSLGRRNRESHRGGCMTHYIDPRPGWIRERTYVLHKSGLRWIDAREQAEAEADVEFGTIEPRPRLTKRGRISNATHVRPALPALPGAGRTIPRATER